MICFLIHLKYHHMSHPNKNWNDMSDSEEEDSWFDDEPEDKAPKVETKGEEGAKVEPKVDKEEG